MNITPIIPIFFTSLFTWFCLGLYFTFSSNLSRLTFIFFHYLVSIISTLFFFSILFKFFSTFNPFWTMICAMISFFIIEFIVFNFFYKQDLWFLNFTDWMVPVFIISTTIYFLGKYFLN